MRGERRALIAIFAGGALGGGLRTGLVELAPPGTGQWPWATFAVNVAGCLLLGYFITRFQGRIAAFRLPFLGTGLCGALTTFSTMQLELLRMLDRGELLLAAAYAAGSVVAGFLGIILGTAVVHRTPVTW